MNFTSPSPPSSFGSIALTAKDSTESIGQTKRFFGYSENAVKSQLWIAVCVYVGIAILKAKYSLEQSYYEIRNYSAVCRKFGSAGSFFVVM